MMDTLDLNPLGLLSHPGARQHCHINIICQQRDIIHHLFTFLDDVTAVLFGIAWRVAYTEGYSFTYLTIPSNQSYIHTRLPIGILGKSVIGRDNTQLHELLQDWIGQEYRYSEEVGRFLHHGVYGNTTGEAEARLIQRYKDWNTSWHVLRSPYNLGDSWYVSALVCIWRDPTRSKDEHLWRSFWERTAVFVNFGEIVSYTPELSRTNEYNHDGSSDSGVCIEIMTEESTMAELFMTELKILSELSSPEAPSSNVELDVERSEPDYGVSGGGNTPSVIPEQNLFYESVFLSYDFNIREQPLFIDGITDPRVQNFESSVNTSRLLLGWQAWNRMQN